ncbi:hypothetical protein BC834DRAFT_839707, partial [Gloeopeniophorella convolvens]
CSDCFGHPAYCRACCLSSHKHLPFHHPSAWTGTHYVSISLTSLGYVLHLGHNGQPCPMTVEVSD